MIKKYKFSVGTRYIKSDWTEEVELEFDDNATEEEIEKEVNEVFEEWVWENAETYWNEI